MAGTRTGGLKSGVLNKQKYGVDFYRTIGRKGGKISRGGGWTGNPEAARLAGAKGGAVSKRRPPEVLTSYVVSEPVSLIKRMRDRFGLN